jgi:hypothetical protein
MVAQTHHIGERRVDGCSLSVKERKRFGAVRGGLCRAELECDAVTIHSRNCRESVQWAAPTSALQLPIPDKLDQSNDKRQVPGPIREHYCSQRPHLSTHSSPLFQRTHETVLG